MFRSYYQLAKPGIIYGNAMTAIAGFFLASKGQFNFVLFLGMLIGISLVIASGCVFNNILDTDIDAKMERTKNRAMVIMSISRRSAIVFGIVLGVIGLLSLFFFSNLLSLQVAVTGFVVYVFIYTPLKRYSVYATEVGSIAGAVPVVVGYISVTNRIDAGAVILFLIMVFWQMPHFYAIAIRRLDEYKAALIPVLPAKRGMLKTKVRLLIYVILFINTSACLTYFKYTGYIYLIVMLLLGLWWLVLGAKGLRDANEIKWAKQVFLFSLVVLVLFSILISFGTMIF